MLKYMCSKASEKMYERQWNYPIELFAQRQELFS
jgi:hypothetical protein